MRVLQRRSVWPEYINRTSETVYLESEAQAETEQAFIDALAAVAAGRCDRGKASQVPHRAVPIQLQIGNVGPGIREVRRVREIERLRAELCVEPFRDSERPVK